MLTKDEKKAETKKRQKAYQKAYHKRRYKDIIANPLKSPEELIEEKYGQFVMFMQDCLLPSTTHYTRFGPLWATYQKYCKAIGQDIEMSRGGFAKVLAMHFTKKMTANGSYYATLIRSKIFIKAEEAVTEPEFIFKKEDAPCPTS